MRLSRVALACLVAQPMYAVYAAVAPVPVVSTINNFTVSNEIRERNKQDKNPFFPEVSIDPDLVTALASPPPGYNHVVVKQGNHYEQKFTSTGIPPYYPSSSS